MINEVSPGPHAGGFAANVANAPPYVPSELSSAYGAQNINVDGSNQVIAILIDTFPNDSDLQSFWQNCNLNISLAQIQKINVGGGSLPAVEGEETLDVSWSSGMAPGAAIRVYAAGGLDFPSLDQALDRTRAGLAAEMLGQASQAFEITLDYLKTRVQFGQVIGTFQSLQHRAARMFTELELTRSCVEAALEAIDLNANDVPQAVALAKAAAGETLHLVSREMVQMHGGIGMTDAHDAGLYMKRARVSEALFGGASFHRDRYATLMGY